MKLVVVGAGYVGLSAAACLAELGHDVDCLENDVRRLTLLKGEEIPFFEPGLEKLVELNVGAGRLRFDSDAALLRTASAVIVCLPTPMSESGEADLTVLFQFFQENRDRFDHESTVFIKSTVPVGTCDQIDNILQRSDVHVVSNPEFVREGSAVTDFLNPDRLIFGYESETSRLIFEEIYCSVKCPVVLTTRRSAELIKYASNMFLATKVSFANSLTEFCERSGADIRDVMVGVGLDHRIGSKYLNPGPGWGGSCLPKDTQALLSMFRQWDVDPQFPSAVIDQNHDHQQRLVERIAALTDGSTEVVHMLGITFKAGTDDTRDSPALSIARALQKRGFTVQAYDPMVYESPSVVPSLKILKSVLDGIEEAAIILVLTDWPEFRELDPMEVAKKTECRVIFDTRNCLDDDNWRSADFVYYGIGR